MDLDTDDIKAMDSAKSSRELLNVLGGLALIIIGTTNFLLVPPPEARPTGQITSRVVQQASSLTMPEYGPKNASQQYAKDAGVEYSH